MSEIKKFAFTSWILVPAFAVLAFAVSPESFWIDEANAALKAIQPDIKSWWHTLVEERGSDLQMPLYMFYIWLFGQVFGTSEYALRIANMPWLILGFSAWFAAFSGEKKVRLGVAVVTMVSPFVWFYLNEARPYSMQLGGSFLVFAALCQLCSPVSLPRSSQRLWSIGLVTGMFIVSASSMLGVIWVGAGLAALFCIVAPKRSWYLVRSFPVIWLFTLLSFVLLGIFYWWTLQLGARASGAASTDLKNLVFVGYEFFGFSGLGPDRLELRAAGPGALIPFLPFLAVHGIAVAVILSFAWKERAELGTRLLWPILIAIAAVVFFFLLGYAAHFRLLGRHFTPLASVILVVLGLGISRAIFRPGIFPKILAGLFIVSSITSCLLLRFSPRHAKDDYRAAASLAKSGISAGKTVVWSADKTGALYYGVPIADTVATGKAWVLINPEASSMNAVFPDIVIASKPDLYDAHNALREFLVEKGYRRYAEFPAFSVWEKPVDRNDE